MTWTYAYTPAIWVPLGTIFLMLSLATYSWRRHSVPGALPFTFALLFAALWAVGSLLEYTAVDLTTKIFWIKFQAAWHLPAAMAVTCFILEYVWPGRWLNRRVLALLSIPPLLVVLLILTDDLHHLMWHSFAFDKTVTPLLGPASWIAIAYGYGFVAVDLIVFAWLFLRSPQHRGFVAIMLAGQVGVRVVYLLERARLIQSDLPLDIFGIAFAYVMYTTALFRFRIFNPIQLARMTVIVQMREGMLVLDPEGRVASLNPAAEQMLGAPEKKARGQPIRELLPAYPVEHLDGEETEIEVSLGAVQGTLEQDVPGQEVRHYTVANTSLKDWRGLDVGRLLLLRDVTAQKLAQAQIVEQERALATMKEREQVARELHDALSQELALINVQAQLVGGLLEAGQAEQARAQLQLLAKLARDTQVDVRGQIRTLSLNIAPQDGFLGALRRLLDIFEQIHEVKTELVLPGDDAAISFPPMVEVQLLRIVQEALTNIRKHARARHVQIALRRAPGCVDLIIEDDGVGFDPENLPAPGRTFGLGIMSARAEEVGGCVAIHSIPGQGTQVVIEVPENLSPGR